MQQAVVKNAERFIFAGNSTFTLKNNKTSNHYTFKMQALAERKRLYGSQPLWFAKVLTGQDNESDFSFVGSVTKNEKGIWYKHSEKAKMKQEAPSVKVLRWFLYMLSTNQLPDDVSVYHEGRCGKCNRKLTNPESIESGFGPHCINFM